MNFSELHTLGGFKIGEVRSALQKAIRRGQEREAMFWASELELTPTSAQPDAPGYGNYVWKTLRIIAAEDIGLGDPLAIQLVGTLNQWWVEHNKNKQDRSGSERLFILLAVAILCRAQKSRMMDHAFMLFYEGDRVAMGMEIPDHALDQHTARGRQLGRTGLVGLEHFFDVGSHLENRADIPDPYEEGGKAARRVVKERGRPPRPTLPQRPPAPDTGQVSLFQGTGTAAKK